MSVYKRVEELYGKVRSLESASGMLNWDSSTFMPTGSMKYRSEDILVINELSEKILISKRLGDLLDDVDEKKCDPWQKANLRLIRKKRTSVIAQDSEITKQLTQASMECRMKWVEARKDNDFKKLQPYLENVVKLTRDQADKLSDHFKCSPYDALLDMHDPGRKTEDIENIAKEMREFLPSFIQEVSEKQKSWKIDIFDGDKFSAEKQKELGLYCMNSIGFDFTRGRLDTSVHPFCGGGTQDVRITTRYNEKEFLSSLMGIMHETGHGLYQQNLPIKYYNQAVGDHLGMSMHESQSLFIEIQISRTKEFLEFALLQAKKIFNFTDNKYSAENFYKVLNKVTPSLIRVDADEVTYPVHVIIRFELEQAIIKGDLKIKDLPGAWNEKMVKYLGIKPDSDANGCMQDIHWHMGIFGYFPTYMIGTMLATQFFSAMKAEMPDVYSNIKVGKFKPIVSWLKNNIHSQGALYTSNELVKRVTKKYLDVKGYQDYLKNKFL